MTGARRNTFEVFRELFEQAKKEGASQSLTGEVRLHHTLDTSETAANIEKAHAIVARRISLIGYNLEWASAIESRTSERPNWHLDKKPEKFQLSLALTCPTTQSDESICDANENFVENIRRHCLKDFVELFELYLDFFHEELLLIQKHGHGFVEDDVIAAEKFTRKSTENKLKKIRHLGIKTYIPDAIISLAKTRNLYVHTDTALSPPLLSYYQGECIWYTHTVKLKERSTGNLIDLANVPDVLHGEHYSQIEITFIDPQKRKSAIVNNQGKLHLSDGDLREIGFFYMACLDEYHKELIKYARENGIAAKDIADYSQKSIIAVSINGDDLPPITSPLWSRALLGYRRGFDARQS